MASTQQCFFKSNGSLELKEDTGSNLDLEHIDKSIVIPTISLSQSLQIESEMKIHPPVIEDKLNDSDEESPKIKYPIGDPVETLWFLGEGQTFTSPITNA